jgi:hypothetical protein
MIAHLYICNRSFRWNGIDKLTGFQQKMVAFQKMMERINKYPEENLLYLFKDSFLSTEILEHVYMSEIISDYDKALAMIGKEAYVILLGIMKHCKTTRATIWDLKGYLSLEDEDTCHAVVVFAALKGLDNHLQVLSTEHGWLEFRRHYLGRYPKTPSFFLLESEKYYPGLKLHPDNKSTMRDVINTHPVTIVYYLSALNDYFAIEYHQSGKDMKEFLPWFAKTHKLEDASLEGSKDDKFYFDFDDNGTVLKAYCEAHLKMYHDDSGNDNQHCRIYFKKPVDGEPHIYVGYIGEHL